MMLIRPPVVREMRQNLWVKMTAKPRPATQAVISAPAEQPDTDMRLERLAALGELRDSGVLTDDEFEREKARILG
jgi:hypothetical protein